MVNSHMLMQEAVGAESAAKRTRLSAKSSPSREAALKATRMLQRDALERDVKQVMNYADEKVLASLHTVQLCSRKETLLDYLQICVDFAALLTTQMA